MSTVNTEKLRQEVEDKYRETKALLDKRLAALKDWRSEKIAAIDVIEGKTDIDEWLSFPPNSGGVGGEEPRGGAPVRKTAPCLGVNQAALVREAVDAMEGPFTNATIREWLDSKRPGESANVNQRSIRTELWRLESKMRKLHAVGTSGSSKVYEKVS